MFELQLDPVGGEHFGKVLNRGVTGSDLFIFNRMTLAALLGRVSRLACAEAERLVRGPLQESRCEQMLPWIEMVTSKMVRSGGLL